MRSDSCLFCGTHGGPSPQRCALCILRGPTECRRKTMPASPARVWRGPETLRPPPRPPKSVGKAAWVGVGAGPTVLCAFWRCTEATPRIRGQPRWRRRGNPTAWGRWVDRAPGGPLPWRCVRCTAPRQCPAQASAAVRIGCHTSNRDAQAMCARQHVRISCHELRDAARGSGCSAHRLVARC